MTQQLTIIDQVKDIESKSGVAFELDITEVTSLAERARKVTSVEDEKFPIIKKELQQKRKYVTEYFKDARDEFNKISKGIIQVQNSILDEFTPEEERLIALDKAEKERVLKEARLEALPAKRERITANGIEFTDEEILTMTDADFELEFATRLSAKLEADRVADEERRAAEATALAEKEAELKRKEEEAERIEQARKEEQARAEEQLRLAKEQAEREKKEAEERREREIKEAEERRKAEEEERRLRIEREEREAKEKVEREKKEAEEAEAKRLADEKFQAFLKENDYNKETDFISADSNGNQRLCRVIATYNPE